MHRCILTVATTMLATAAATSLQAQFLEDLPTPPPRGKFGEITFSGGNKHYETNDEWHEKGGLTDYLAEAFKYHGHSGRQVLTHAASLFAEDAENLAREITHRGGLSSPDAQQAINHLAGMWGQLFTGAPLDFESFG